MNEEILLVGTREFLRLWGLLGIAGKEIDAQVSFDALKDVGAESGVRIIFYEENLTDRLTSLQKKYLESSSQPTWIPLPSATGLDE